MAYYVSVSGGPVSANAVSGGSAYEQAGVGFVGITLDGATVLASGALAIRGVLSLALAGSTAAGTGEVDIAATSGVTLAGATVVATASIANKGTVALGLDNIETVFTGAIANEGALSVTLDGATAEGSFIVGTFGFLADRYRFVGVSGYAVSAFSVSGQYFQDRPGAIILQSATLVATGALLISGAADLTLDDATVAAMAGVRIDATANITLDDVTMAATSDIRARIRLRGSSRGGGVKGGVSSVGGGAKMRLAA